MAETTAAKGARSAPAPVIEFEALTDKDVAVLTSMAQGWRPEVGDEIEGRVLGAVVGTSENVEENDKGEKVVKITKYPILFILRDGSTGDDVAVALHCFHAVSQNKVVSARPEYGDRVYVRYLGQAEAKSKQRAGAHLYAIHFPGKGATESVWDTFTSTS